jgi:hypothetical protein
MGADKVYDTAPAQQVATPVPAVEPPLPAAPVPLPAESGAAAGIGTMTVGHAEDPAERDADRRADVALSRLRRRAADTGDAAAEQHQHGPGCSHLRRAPGPDGSALVGRAGGELDASTSRRIAGLKGSGRALPGEVREEMEGAFGASFADVRIHVGEQAAGLNRLVSARAFTTGKDIFFGAGEYAPTTSDGRRTLAHELAHTLQPAGAVHRIDWWPFGKKDPAKQAKKDNTKLAQQREKDEDKEFAADRAEGRQVRGQMKAQVTQEMQANQELAKKDDSSTTDAIGTNVKRGEAAGGSKFLNELTAKFERAKKDEADLYKMLLGIGKDPDAAAAEAYETYWVEIDDEELKRVAPPRKSETDRLKREILAERNRDNAERDSQEHHDKIARGRGKLLDADVEMIYEQWVVETERLMKGPPALGKARASVLAEQTVWSVADPAVAKKRPSDPRLERQARLDAELRVKSGKFGKPPALSTLESALATGAAVDKGAGMVDMTATKATKVGLGMAGSGKDSALKQDFVSSKLTEADKLTKSGDTAGAKAATDAAQNTGADHSLGAKVPVVGKVVSASEDASYNVKKGIRNPDAQVSQLPTSVETQAKEGISKTTGILNDIIKGVNNVLKMVDAISEAHKDPSTDKVLAATKACADVAASLATLGGDVAGLAKYIDAGVTGAVAQVIPGFNIAVAAANLVSGAISIFTNSQQLAHANESLFDARMRPAAGKPVDVLVRPLLLVAERFGIALEQSKVSTARAVVSLSTSIATVASAGGFGIPSAVEAANGAIGTLYSLGDLVRSNYLAVLTAKARSAGVEAAEGSSEEQMRRDPLLATEAIAKLAKKGDAIAVQFVATFGFSGPKLASAKMGEISAAILKEMGTDANPMTTYQSFKQKIGSAVKAVGGAVSGAGTKWKETETLAQDRQGDGKDRDVWWRLKMMFTSEESFTRSKNKTAAKKTFSDVVCRVGKAELLANSDKAERTRFWEQLQVCTDRDIEFAIRDVTNPPEWRDKLRELQKARVLAASGVGKKGP